MSRVVKVTHIKTHLLLYLQWAYLHIHLSSYHQNNTLSQTNPSNSLEWTKQTNRPINYSKHLIGSWHPRLQKKPVSDGGDFKHLDFERGFYSGFTSAQHTDHNITSVSSFLQWGFYSFTVCCRITYAGYYTVVRFSACWDEQPLQDGPINPWITVVLMPPSIKVILCVFLLLLMRRIINISSSCRADCFIQDAEDGGRGNRTNEQYCCFTDLLLS